MTITEAKNRLSSLIDAVQSGETVLIVDRGRPVARLDTAVSASVEDPDGRLARLERAGVVRRSLAGPAVLEGLASPPSPVGGSALRALIEERRAGR